jgi:hypothetical protein
MPIQHVHVENFKSFSELDIELSRFHVLIGSNAAGKSNFISIFKFLRDITRHGIVNAVAMQGGSEYLQNTNIGSSRDLVIRVVYQPDQKVEILEQQECKKTPLLAIQSCQSSYEFAIRFDGPGDGFSITRDRLIIGCEVMSCDDSSGQINDRELICRKDFLLPNRNSSRSISAGKNCRKRHCSLKPPMRIPCPMLKNSLTASPYTISIQNC